MVAFLVASAATFEKGVDPSAHPPTLRINFKLEFFDFKALKRFNMSEKQTQFPFLQLLESGTI